MRYYEDNINSNSYIEFSKNKSKANLKICLNKLKKRYNV